MPVMDSHNAADSAPSNEWIETVLGKRHRLSLFHNPAAGRADQSALLWMFPFTDDVEDYAHRAEAYRNLGTAAASHILQEVFVDFDAYVLRVSEQRVLEHRPIRSDDALHGDVFIDTHVATDGTDAFGVRTVFTDTIGAMVFTNFATFVGRLETQSVRADTKVELLVQQTPGLAASH